jgi:hypothetical protein
LLVAGGEAEHGGKRDNQGEPVVHQELNMRSWGLEFNLFAALIHPTMKG